MGPEDRGGWRRRGLREGALNRVWQTYGAYSAIQLSNATHDVGTPWHGVYMRHGGKIPKRTDIPEEFMGEHFRALARSGSVSK